MQHFVLPAELSAVLTGTPPHTVDLSAADYHYLIRVRRLGRGDRFPAVARGGARYQATVTEVDAGTARLELVPDATGGLDAAAPDAAASVALTLVQALARPATMDRIVRQATELGVWRIVPVRSARSARLDEQRLAARITRWQRIARAAAEQSGALPPEIAPPTSVQALVADGPTPSGTDAGLVFHPTAGDGIDTALGALAATRVPRQARCVVGPEAGLSEAEIQWLTAAGFRAVNLGQLVLRVDTAAVAALAITRERLDELARNR